MVLSSLVLGGACRFAGKDSRVGGGETGGELDLRFFLARLWDLDGLARLEEGVRTAQFSSYDRKSRIDPATGELVGWDANGDSGNYLRVEANGEAVLAEIEGPGCIWRIWSANPQGRIRFYFDGAQTPSLEFGFKEFFQGKDFPFPRPLLWQRGQDLGGENPASDSYVPIPFARSCRVTADKAHPQYYEIGYSTFPADWKVRTFRLPISPEEAEAVRRAVSVLARAGRDPQPSGPTARMVEGETRLEKGAPVELLNTLEGPGFIRSLELRTGASRRWGSRRIILRMYWDGEERPSVECPVADFFGEPWNEDPYRGLPVGIRSGRGYSYFRMPFERSARIEVENLDSVPATIEYAMVLERGELPKGSARFHARWRRERDGRSFDYPVLDCEGAPGKFVGMVLSTHNFVGTWWGEGDEKVWVDGETFPSTFGTGSEDYFGDAWGIRHFSNPYHGCPTALDPEATRRQSCYRWHVSDAIPFERSFRMSIENYSALGEGPARNDYSSVAYWYQAPGGSESFPPVTAEDVEPQLHAIAGLVEAEAALALPSSDPALAGEGDGSTAPSVRVERDETLAPREMSGGKGLRIRGPEGFEVPVKFAAPAPGDYTVEVVTPEGVPSDEVRLYADGQPLEDRVRFGSDVRGFSLRFGKKPAGGWREAWVDGFALHPYKNFVREWYVIGPFPNKEDGGLDVAYGPELEPFAAFKAYSGKSGEVRWTRVRAASGVVQGTKVLKDQENLVAYAAAVVRSPDARKCTALLGSDDGVKVWIRGRLVHRNHTHRVVVQDQDRFEVDLEAGENSILLKIDQGGGPWGFSFRIEDPDDVLEYGLPE